MRQSTKLPSGAKKAKFPHYPQHEGVIQFFLEKPIIPFPSFLTENLTSKKLHFVRNFFYNYKVLMDYRYKLGVKLQCTTHSIKIEIMKLNMRSVVSSFKFLQQEINLFRSWNLSAHKMLTFFPSLHTQRSTAFAKSGKKTITVKPGYEKFQRVIDNNYYFNMSPTDVRQVNLMYKCPGTMIRYVLLYVIIYIYIVQETKDIRPY